MTARIIENRYDGTQKKTSQEACRWNCSGCSRRVISSIHTFYRELKPLTGGGIEPLQNANAAVNVAGTLAEKRENARQEAMAINTFTTTNLPKWNGTKTPCLSGNTFTVDSPEDFAYALANAGGTLDQAQTINILCDIDMNGQNKVFTEHKEWTNVIVNGNNNSIYNLKIKSAGHTGLCSYAVKATVKNLNVVSPYFEATPSTGDDYADVGLIPKSHNTANDLITMENCIIRDGKFINNHKIASGRQHAGAFAGYVWNLRYKNCQSQRNTIIGTSHVGGFMGEYETAFFEDCSSEDNLVLGFGEHSGAFASCSNTWGEFIRCWSNSTIYGNSYVGGFTSGCDAGAQGAAYPEVRGAYYKDCFSSGVVEGEKDLGGFIGQIELTRTGEAVRPKYENCYSISMVGMNYNGVNIGGFAGIIKSGIFKNCYAAGEVGSIDTNSNTAISCGGFGGYINKGDIAMTSGAKYIVPEITDCCYDMQTTAMKNKAIGNENPLDMSRENGLIKTTERNGVTGYTTREMTGKNISSKTFASCYTFTDGLYPQLDSLVNHEDIVFRAQSAASAATVFCDEWQDIAPATGFDTVRDTMRNYAFSSLEPFGTNTQFEKAQVKDNPNISSISWETDGNTSPLDNKTPVVSITDKPYYTSEINPGIEWVSVSLDYSKDGAFASGSRRLRLIPTSVIRGGDDKRIDVLDTDEYGNNATELYNHKEGFTTTYLDAKTLQAYATGTQVPSTVPSPFSAIQTQAMTGSQISGTLLLPMNESTTSMNVTATMTDITGKTISIDNLYDKLNGSKRFEAEDSGMYSVTYKASLADGRYLSATKKLIVTAPWSVVYNYNYDGLLSGERITQNSIFAAQCNLKSFDDFDFYSYGASPQRDGWRFAYWSLDPQGKKPVTQSWFDKYEEENGELGENIDVYAQWNRVLPNASEANVTIKPGFGSYNDTFFPTVMSGEPDSRILIESATPPSPMYEFAGWNTDAIADGKLEKSDTDGIWIFTFGYEDSVLEALYTPLFEDKGLVIEGVKKLIDGELVDGQFEFELEGYRDLLADTTKNTSNILSFDVDEKNVLSTVNNGNKFSFDNLNLGVYGIQADETDDGCTYYYFMLTEKDLGQSCIVYDPRTYVVEVKSVYHYYEERYVPLEIKYYEKTAYGELIDVAKPVFENRQVWLEMPFTGSSQGLFILSGGISFIAFFFIIYGTRCVNRDRRRYNTLS